MESFTLHTPARIEFGEGALDRAGISLSVYGSRALVIADQVGRDSGVVTNLEASLEYSGVQAIVFDSIPNHATSAVVGEIVQLGRAGRALFVIGVGDESVLSIAQLVAACIPGDIDAESFFRNGNAHESLPFAAIPTRIGHPFLLAEQALYVDSRNRNIVVMDTRRPTDALIMDPACANDAHAAILAYTTADLLLSSLEGLCGKRSSFLTNMYLHEALHTLSRFVSGDDEIGPEALLDLYRVGMLVAFSGTYASPGIGSALSYSLAAKTKVPKIAVSAILAPSVSAMLSDAVPERMADAEQQILSSNTSASVSEAIGGFLSNAGLPLRLRELEIDKADLLHAAYSAYETDMVRLSAVPVTAEELHALLDGIY